MKERPSLDRRKKERGRWGVIETEEVRDRERERERAEARD